MSMFKEKDRGKFNYWFAHWCAFQMVAVLHGMWKPKYLLHDIEKPWMMLFIRDYKKVQHIHRTKNRHHLEYEGGVFNMDIEGTIIDWECSRFTKEKSPLTARALVTKLHNEAKAKKDEKMVILYRDYFTPVLNKYNFV